jgi:repressor LexA
MFGARIIFCVAVATAQGIYLNTMRRRSLTERQLAILNFVRDFRTREGFSPSRRDIQHHFRFASPHAVTKHLRALERKGALDAGGGRARALVPASVKLRPPAVPSPAPTLREIPLYGVIPAGLSTESRQEKDACVRVDLDALKIPRNARTFALKVRGDSMTGVGILDGDIVILELKPPSSGDVVAALIDGESTLKTYVVKNRRPFLRAENPAYPNLIPAQELVVQGVMIALLRTV